MVDAVKVGLTADILNMLIFLATCVAKYKMALRGREKELSDKMGELEQANHLINELKEIAGEEEKMWWKASDNITAEHQKLREDREQACLNMADFCCHCCSVYNFNTRTEDLLNRVRDLVDPNKKIKMMHWRRVDRVVQDVGFNMSSMVGVERDLGKVRAFLVKDGVGMMGIYGNEGVGKTALLRFINNSLFDGSLVGGGEPIFDLVIRIGEEAASNSDKMQRVIFERLNLTWWPSKSEDVEAERNTRAVIINRLLGGKSFLLLIDNIWSLPDLYSIGIPSLQGYHPTTMPPHPAINHHTGPSSHPALVPPSQLSTVKQQKLIFTTGSNTFNHSKNSIEQLRMGSLEGDKALELFRKIRLVPSSPRVEKIIKESKVPARSLIVYSNLQASSGAEDMHDIHVLLSMASLSEYQVRELNKLMFKIIFTKLSDDETRKCCLSCALWPKGYSIKKKKLIETWMGLGLVDERDVGRAYERGHTIIRNLKRVALLEDGKDEEHEVQMHGTNRREALAEVSSNKGMSQEWLVPEGGGKDVEEGQHANNWNTADRVSRIDNCMLTKLSPKNHRKCPKLSVLMLQRCSQLKSICPGVLPNMPSLTHLDLSATCIEILPTDIGELIHLNYLNLSRTQITSLPDEMKNLKALRYLCLKGTASLSIIREGVISSLTELRVLNLYRSNFSDWLEEQGITTESGKFEELSHLKDLIAFGATVRSASAVDTLPGLPNLKVSSLYITSLDNTSVLHLSPEFLGCSANMRSLQTLKIAKCGKLEEVKMGGGNEASRKWSQLTSLSTLHLSCLSKLQSITWDRVHAHICFVRLETIKIDKCDELVDVTWVLRLPCLTKLQLSSCNKLTHLIGKVDAAVNGEEVSSFSHLQVMVLEDLPNLSKICGNEWTLHSITGLRIYNCPALRELPNNLRSNSKKLRKIETSNKWVDGLSCCDEDKSWIRGLMSTVAAGHERDLRSLVHQNATSSPVANATPEIQEEEQQTAYQQPSVGASLRDDISKGKRPMGLDLPLRQNRRA